MKKIIYTMMMALFMTIADAQTITVINNGKSGGSFHARTLMYKDGLEQAGITVKYENIGKISQAVQVFKESEEPTIMVYANNQVFKQDLFHTSKNFIMLEYQQPLYVCTTNEAKGKSGTLTVAHGKGYDPKLLTAVLGDDIVLVPYKNSGAMLKGMLGGDVDMMVNNQGKSFKYMMTGQGTCVASDVLPIMAATVIGKNVNVKTIRRLLVDISNTNAFYYYHTSRKLHRPSGTWKSEYELVRELEKGYEIKK